MGFKEAEEYLDSLGIDAMKSMGPSLERIEALLEALDHPERRVPAIHLTGTNGKTSTARILSSILTATGLSVGTYSSPHLQTVRERITRDGAPLSEDEFGELFDHLRPYLELVEQRLGERLTYFEILTAMFFLWAAEAPVDAMVVEVGLGGRWDATNLMDGKVAVITNIGLDHTKILGENKVSIAKEKVGIIKEGATVVTGERLTDAARVIDDAVAATDASLRRLGDDFELTENAVAVGGRYLTTRHGERVYEGLFLPLHGAHQAANAALAIETARAFLPARDLEQEVIAEGLAQVVVPGRIEAVRSPAGAQVVLDVAHNPDGMSAFISSVVEAFAFERATFVVGVLADKDLAGIMREIARIPCRVIATEARSQRSFSAREVARAAEALGLENHAIADVAEAVSHASKDQAETEIVCVTGSHYVVGEAREAIRA